MKYGYVRISSKDQKLDRQIHCLKEMYPDILDENIFADKQSGKDFSREEYQKLKKVVKVGDEVVVKELDRFGRNKDEIKQELAWFRERKVIVRILDVPTTLMDFKDQDWLFDMVNNILIEVLGAIAQQEREKIKLRQAEGIVLAKAEGKYKGRKPIEVKDFIDYYNKVNRGKISVGNAVEKLDISRSKWYRLCAKQRAVNN